MRAPAFFALALGLLLAGCMPEHRAIDYGHDACAFCRMTVADPRYGSELVTATGKVVVFDSIECLAGYLDANPDADVHSLWVTDFAHPETLIPAEEALYLHSDALRSPMALNVAAFADAEDRAVTQAGVDGTPLDWSEVRALARNGAHGAHPMPSASPAAMPTHR